jgi:hypothetical protein
VQRLPWPPRFRGAAEGSGSPASILRISHQMSRCIAPSKCRATTRTAVREAVAPAYPSPSLALICVQVRSLILPRYLCLEESAVALSLLAWLGRPERLRSRARIGEAPSAMMSFGVAFPRRSHCGESLVYRSNPKDRVAVRSYRWLGVPTGVDLPYRSTGGSQ